MHCATPCYALQHIDEKDSLYKCCSVSQLQFSTQHSSLTEDSLFSRILPIDLETADPHYDTTAMVLMSVSLPIRLRKAGAAAAVEFSMRLANPPDELRVMIVREAVSTPEVIDLRQYGQARFKITEPFRVDDDLLVIAREEFDRVNRFRMPSTLVCSAELAMRIRHLQVYFTLTCKGGVILPAQSCRFPVSNQDTTALANILRIFTRLDSFEIVLDNTGRAVNGIVYTNFGRRHPQSRVPNCKAMERMLTVRAWVIYVRSISLPQWRQGLEVDKRLTIIHSYALQKSRVEIGLIGPTAPPDEDTGRSRARLYEILDAPVAVMRYAAVGSKQAAQIEENERQKRDQELEADGGAESQ